MANTPLQNLLKKEVSRQEFIGFLGLAIVSIAGMGRIIKLLSGKSLATNRVLASIAAQNGYGK